MKLFGQISELFKIVLRKNTREVTLEPSSSTASTGDVIFRLAPEVGPSTHELTTNNSAQTLTNKSVDADTNTLSNIANAHIKALAAIDWTKISKTGSNLADLDTRSHTDLTSAGTNSHATIDTHLGSSSGVHGVAGSVVGTSDTQVLTGKTISGTNNTISGLVHGVEVDSPSTGVHGVTGSVVGTSDIQTLTNKTLDGAEVSDFLLIDEQLSTPATPAAGKQKLYILGDGLVYKLDSAGSEVPVSGTGGAVWVNLVDTSSTTLPTVDPATIDGTTVSNGMLVLFTGLTVGAYRIYKAAISLGTITWTAQALYSAGLDPANGDMVVINQGTRYAEARATYLYGNFRYEPRIKQIISGMSVERIAMSSSTLSILSTTTIYDVDATIFKDLELYYTATDATSKETGKLLVTTDGTNVDFSQQFVSLGTGLVISFQAQISAGNLQIQVVNGSTSVAFKFFYKRWGV